MKLQAQHNEKVLTARGRKNHLDTFLWTCTWRGETFQQSKIVMFDPFLSFISPHVYHMELFAEQLVTMVRALVLHKWRWPCFIFILSTVIVFFVHLYHTYRVSYMSYRLYGVHPINYTKISVSWSGDTVDLSKQIHRVLNIITIIYIQPGCPVPTEISHSLRRVLFYLDII